MSLGLRVWTSDLVMSEGSATACDSQLDSTLTQTEGSSHNSTVAAKLFTPPKRGTCCPSRSAIRIHSAGQSKKRNQLASVSAIINSLTEMPVGSCHEPPFHGFGKQLVLTKLTPDNRDYLV